MKMSQIWFLAAQIWLSGILPPGWPSFALHMTLGLLYIGCSLILFHKEDAS